MYKIFISYFLFAVGLLLSVKSQAQLNPLNLGKIAPGDSIVIYYDVTINAPCGCTQISNQGTITGSNFSSLVTDDPKTATAADPTITLLNMFPLPITLTSFQARKLDGRVELTWEGQEIDVLHYEVERSAEGRTFGKIATIASVGNGQNRYRHVDNAPLPGEGYYRLRIVDKDGKVKFSPVVQVSFSYGNRSVQIFPNPVRGTNINLRLNNMPKDDYQVALHNAAGQVVLQTVVKHQGGSAVLSLNTQSLMGKGLFMLSVRGKAGNFTHKLAVE